MTEYKFIIDPPTRCSTCSNNVIEFLKTDKQLIEYSINSNSYKKTILGNFLIYCKNKTLGTSILDPAILEVLE